MFKATVWCTHEGKDDAVEAARLVFDLDLDVNARNDLSRTALHGAASAARSSRPIRRS